MSYRLLRVLLLGVFLVLIASQSAIADNVYATIRGTVTDPSNAVVQGAAVTAKSTGTGIEYTTNSNSTGFYEFLQLPVGTYTVSVSKQGFKSFKSVGITLNVNQTYDQPVKLAVGAASETVEVRASAVQVETTSIQQQTLVNSQQIVDLPLLGRDFTQLEQLAPGVMASNDRMGTFSVNGSQTQQSSYLVNGTDTNDIALNTPGIRPSPDAIQEFNLISSTINPEYGRNSGGIVNALIKNGTNSWHGNAFEFYRDTFLNTRNFFTVGPQQPIFHQNLFGGTFGGPVLKDKTFFFLSYQGTRNATGTPTTVTVFSPTQRTGFFPDIATSTNVSPIPLQSEAGPVLPAGTPYSTLFPTGHIPTADFNTIAKNLMNQFVPFPNGANNQFGFSAFNTSKTHQGIARVDHNITSSDLLWGVAIFSQNDSTQGLPFTGANLPGFGSFSTSGIKNFTISENHTFNNSTLNEVRLGYFRLNFDAVEPQHPVLPSSFGFTGIIPQNPKAAGLPTISIPGFFTLGFSDNGPQPRKDQNYQFTDNFSKIVGKHSLKFGFDMRRFQVDNPFFFLNNGHFDYGTGAGVFTTGDPLADFLLGLPDDYAQNSGGFINARAYEYYSYGQDLWKVRNSLTLTLGVGYQIDTPYQNNQFGGLAYNCIIPGQQSKIFPTAPQDLNFPGDKNCTNSGTEIKYGHVAPRFGFAWAPHWGAISGRGTDKLSIRGGFGLYFNRFEEETALQNLGAPPFGVGSLGAGDFGGSPAFASPFSDVSGAGSEPNKFPFTPPAVGSAVDFTFFEPLSINTNDPKLSTPYSMNFNLGIQREFPGNTVMSMGYVGSLGRHLYRAYEGDSITAAGQAACAASASCRGLRSLQHFFFPSHTVLGANLAQCPPFGDCFGSVGTQFTDGTSNYSAMQVNVTKGMTHGLQLITSYTWSHAIDNGSGFENSGFGGARRGTNVLVPSLNVGDSAFDARQRLVISYIYQVPSLHHLVSALPDRIFGGWKLTGITTFQTGFPIDFFDSGFRSLSCDVFTFFACPDNANQIASSVRTLDPRTSSFGGKNNYWFDPCSFGSTVKGCNPANRVPLGSFGNAGRNSLHGPGINNFDFSLQKDTKITERTSFQMGIEAFNLFNHTQFGNPNTRVNSTANFGRITTAGAGRLVQLRAKVNF